MTVRHGGQEHSVSAKFVFIGTGGGSLPLLQKSGLPEGKGYGGFPVSGIWLRCDTQAVVQQHAVKVYGKAESGSPPMSVPHLDARIVDGQHSLLFGPYAGFSTRFLKHGKLTDLFESLSLTNVIPLLDVVAEGPILRLHFAEVDDEVFPAQVDDGTPIVACSACIAASPTAVPVTQGPALEEIDPDQRHGDPLL